MEGDDTSLPTRVAALVHAHFDTLPAHYKPRTRDDGSTEWIPMSGIVAVRGMYCFDTRMRTSYSYMPDLFIDEISECS
jgi:hypothetical protein